MLTYREIYSKKRRAAAVVGAGGALFIQVAFFLDGFAKSSMERVNLFIIGVNKAGTSWLYYLLNSHPEVFMAEEKELYYFGERYPDAREEYHSHFPFHRPYRYFGEATPMYYREAGIAAEIREYCPEAAVLAIVRDPVRRLVSQFYYHKQLGLIDEEKPVAEVNGTAAKDFRLQSHYERTLPAFSDTFGSEQFRVISLEEANQDLTGFWEDLQQYLDLTVVPVPDFDAHPSNATGGRWFRMLYRRLVRPVKRLRPDLYRALLRSPLARRAKNGLLRLLGTADKEEVPPEVMESLRREFEPTYEYLADLGFQYYRHDEITP